MNPADRNGKGAGRYPWDAAPEWAQFATTDEDGECWWHDIEPEPVHFQDIGWWRSFGRLEYICGNDRSFLTPDWDASLESRPAAAVRVAQEGK